MAQLYMRFRNKPVREYDPELTFIELGGMWVHVYKEVKLMGVNFVSEASWEKNWFERNPRIYDMIKTRNKVTARKVVNHEIPGIAFLAQEIINDNYIAISEDDKIFY